MNKLFFIVGMRRSGTSILRQLILKHPQVEKIAFEPYELWHSIRVSHISRYKNDPYVKKIIQDFRISYSPGKYTGAKFALNAGIEAITWRRLGLVFPEAKFIFIIRNSEDTYNSWVGQDKDSVRGLCPKELYKKFRNHIVDSFVHYEEKNLKTSHIISYEHLIENPDEEMENVYRLLDIAKMGGLSRYMKKPKNWSK